MTAIKYMGKIWWHENVYGLYVHQTQKPEDLKRCCDGVEMHHLNFLLWDVDLTVTLRFANGTNTVSAEATFPRFPAAVSIGEWVVAGLQ